MKSFKKAILAVAVIFLVQIFAPIATVSASQEGIDSSQSIDTAVPYRARDIPGLGSGPTLGRIGGTAGAIGLGGLIINQFSPHSKNARKSTHDKHTKRRPGGSEKKKQKSSWKRNR